MYTIRKRLEVCYGHRLMEYDGKCGHPHGHGALVEVELRAPLTNRSGMVLDFHEVDRVVGEIVDRELDHRMLLREDDPLVGALRALGEEPRLMADNPTAENIARLLHDRARQAGMPVVAIRVWETRDSMAEYREA